jgi:methyltransferase
VASVTSRELYFGFVLLLAAERLVELLVSGRNARLAFELGGRETGRRHYRVMVALHALFLVACPGEVFLLQRDFPGLLGFVALGGAVAAQSLRWWSIATLGARWSTRIVVWPDAVPVTTGPYQIVRHPNYLAVVIEIASVPLVHGAWITAIIFTCANAILLVVRIRAEEEALGPVYARAFEERPRFLPTRRPLA